MTPVIESINNSYSSRHISRPELDFLKETIHTMCSKINDGYFDSRDLFDLPSPRPSIETESSPEAQKQPSKKTTHIKVQADSTNLANIPTIAQSNRTAFGERITLVSSQNARQTIQQQQIENQTVASIVEPTQQPTVRSQATRSLSTQPQPKADLSTQSPAKTPKHR
ncbi:uncharacterized protein LOC129571732 [Sitodiplosis mosellana]|uniref:uncharacterized protein LOC129571732 n=1 Tax=Sitodiplosis mosellana TaxID=263140 RepID=UPI0024451FAD|nr:uncharacterized protein LOC129571732 [Sitodiplosis mosellana]